VFVYNRIDIIKIVTYSFQILIVLNILLNYSRLFGFSFKKFEDFVSFYTEPILKPLRFNHSLSIPIDFSPIFAFIIIHELERLSIHIVTTL
jgi:uncharacterized protein YggT (Ycf19 family)